MNVRKQVIYIYLKRYKIKWNKIILSIVSASFWLKTIGIFLVLVYELTGIFKWGMPLIDYTEDSKYYYVFNGIHQMKYGSKILVLLLLMDVIIFGIISFYLIKQNAAKKLLIIEHSSMQHMSFSYDDREMLEYAVKKHSINQSETINNKALSLESKVTLLITEIENEIPKINDFINRNYQIGYAGIPVGNIPCVFLLGYKLDDANKKLYLHKNRNNALDDNFHILKDESTALKLISEQIPNNCEDIGKILVVIQLTQPIKDTDLTGVLEDNDYVLKYSIPNQINYDIISSAIQTNEYVDQIVSDIADVQKNENINEIKICVAASSDFIFALGTKFSKTQNIDTVIFQFDQNRYKWGINVSKEVPVIIK